jgi:hypothetical protein
MDCAHGIRLSVMISRYDNHNDNDDRRNVVMLFIP